MNECKEYHHGLCRKKPWGIILLNCSNGDNCPVSFEKPAPKTTRGANQMSKTTPVDPNIQIQILTKQLEKSQRIISIATDALEDIVKFEQPNSGVSLQFTARNCLNRIAWERGE